MVLFKVAHAVLVLKREIERREKEKEMIFQAIYRMPNNHSKLKLLRDLKNVGITEEKKKDKTNDQRN